ncbi:MAG: D-inositol-3-phosphate glycosyltransferase [Actinomycetota bacterium]|jgi:D-inositol-3-phosphate glycosyltransferase|nr:D-inositol-3-phosphate glycosyltransferase [Actinomycetota bacterium]
MRTAVISYHSSPLDEPGSGDAGGMTVYIRDLAETLAARGVSTDVFTRATSDGPAVVELKPGFRVVFVKAGPIGHVSKEELPDHIEEFTAGVRAFADDRSILYDIVHSHYWQSGLAGIGLREAWNVPLVHSHHTLGRVKNRFLAPGDVPEPEMRLIGEAAVIRAADVLIASTDDEQEHLACLYGAHHDKAKTLHPGVDHGLFRPGDAASARAALGLGGEAVVLFVGRIQRLKGIELALRAVEQIHHGLDRPLTFLIVGGASGRDGAEEVERLRALSEELGIEHIVRFEGPLPHKDLPLYYQAADVVTVCSHSESFGFAALEAHACGIPVIGTPVGGISHIVTDGSSGFLIDSRDPTEFAARLKTVLADSELREQFRERALSNASHFTWERTADEFLELYECLVREDSPEICTCV